MAELIRVDLAPIFLMLLHVQANGNSSMLVHRSPLEIMKNMIYVPDPTSIEQAELTLNWEYAIQSVTTQNPSNDDPCNWSSIRLTDRGCVLACLPLELVLTSTFIVDCMIFDHSGTSLPLAAAKVIAATIECESIFGELNPKWLKDNYGLAMKHQLLAKITLNEKRLSDPMHMIALPLLLRDHLY